MDANYYAKSISETLKIFRSSENGLSANEAERRLSVYGSNTLPEGKPRKIWIIFFSQFKSPLIYILFGAAAVVFAMGEIVDGLIIMFVLIFNACVGAIQEGKAQNTLLALKNYVQTRATVLRDGQEMSIIDKDVAQGDIIVLQEGQKVPADARIILSNNLKADESAITGESTPVQKIAQVIFRPNLSIADQKNMVFRGSNILAGNGRAVAVATGKDTAIGRIAVQIAKIHTEIPLAKNIKDLSIAIIAAVAFINIVIFVFGIFSAKPVKELFMTLVSLSVSIIPEGLPIVVTLILATGVWRMSKQNALVKKMQAVEALGQASVIALDKTGTITKNEMTVQKIFFNNNFFEIDGVGYEPKGTITLAGEAIDPLNHPDLLLFAKYAALCANAKVVFSKKESQWHVLGDPTQAAISVLAQKIGFHKHVLEKEMPLIREFAFDYRLKYQACLRYFAEKKILIVSGAPENVLSMSVKYWRNGKSEELSEKNRLELKKIFEKMSADGLRVVAMAILNNPSDEISEKNIGHLTFMGFLGMKDALRQQAVDAIYRARRAGLRIIMITGDHAITAKAIAKEAGIFRDGDKIITGAELDSMSDRQLLGITSSVSVFARVMPEHKLRIINAFKQSKKIIAMTGDGVNDAPSLVAADLGVAMGKIGTEVAKEAADIVLLDDNFSSIVAAIEEGRSIYKTIKKVILYLFSTSMGEVLTIAGAIAAGLPLPLLPSQIIWLNFVTDGFLDVALAMEPKEENLLQQKFKKPNRYLVDKLMVMRMAVMSVVMMLGTLAVFTVFLRVDFAKAQTMALLTLAVFQWCNAYNCRFEKRTVFTRNIFSNRYLLAATLIVICLQLLAVYNPFLQKILHTSPLNLQDWLIALVVGFSIILAEELRKTASHLFEKYIIKKSFEV